MARVATDWFPNGVDSAHFAPAAEPYDPDSLSIIERMDYYPNQECMFDFYANVLPRIRARRPQGKLLIVGTDPASAAKRLGELPGVKITVSAPGVRPYLHRSAPMVAPLEIALQAEQDPGGQGFRRARRGERGGRKRRGHAGQRSMPFVADADEGYAAICLRIVDDRETWECLAETGRACMLSHRGG